MTTALENEVKWNERKRIDIRDAPSWTVKVCMNYNVIFNEVGIIVVESVET